MGQAEVRAWALGRKRTRDARAGGYPVAEMILPHDDVKERVVRGVILVGNSQCIEFIDTLKADDFFNAWHIKIASSILNLHAVGSRPDLLAVHDELVKNNGAEQAGGVAYVASLLDGIALKSDVLYVLRGLRRMAAFRQAVDVAEHVHQLALKQAGSVASLLNSAVEKLSSLARDLESTEDDGTPYFDSASQALAVAREGARLKIYTHGA